MNILYLSAEVAPFAKVGGLGDVGGGLPRALSALGHDVRVALPGYRSINRERYGFRPVGGPHMTMTGAGEKWFGVLQSDALGLPAYIVDYDELFGRDSVYGYADDAVRFIFFCRAMLDFLRDIDFVPDILHCHDWHTSYGLAWLDTAGRYDDLYRSTAGVLTIHNAMHQGHSAYDTVRYGMLDGWLPIMPAWEPYGGANWLARGVSHADAINAVSPRFALEITMGGGFGLDGLYRARQERLTGILNGIDAAIWDPATDSHLAANFTAESLGARIENKRALQLRARLPQLDDVPLLAFIGRLDVQKGLDFTLPALEYLLDTQEVQFVLLGSGAPEYEQRCRALAEQHPDRVALFLQFNADLAPLIYAACDIFLMPSLFEPCGLGQMLAMRYGAVPVVRATGGLADTVSDSDPLATPPRLGTGFRFEGADAFAVGWALDRAVKTYRTDAGLWWQIQLRGMAQDFSWERSAGEYEALYNRARVWHGG